MTPLRVLYVDDDPDIREVAELALKLDPGLDVRVAASGAEALEVLQTWPADAIVLDVMMPIMDGPALSSAISTQLGPAAPPVVFITARAMASEVADLLALGARGVITKPFDPMTLAADLRRVLGWT